MCCDSKQKKSLPYYSKQLFFFEARTVTAIAPVLKTLRALTNHSEVRCDCDLVSLLLKKSFDDFLESKHLVTGRKKLMRKLRKSRGSFRFN